MPIFRVPIVRPSSSSSSSSSSALRQPIAGTRLVNLFCRRQEAEVRRRQKFDGHLKALGVLEREGDKSEEESWRSAAVELDESLIFGQAEPEGEPEVSEPEGEPEVSAESGEVETAEQELAAPSARDAQSRDRRERNISEQIESERGR